MAAFHISLNRTLRYLSDDERDRLLIACREPSWTRLYLLVLMALTTGARRGELLGLRWKDIDLERGEALIGVDENTETKNGDARCLILLPQVATELDLFAPKDAHKSDALVVSLAFASVAALRHL